MFIWKTSRNPGIYWSYWKAFALKKYSQTLTCFYTEALFRNAYFPNEWMTYRFSCFILSNAVIMGPINKCPQTIGIVKLGWGIFILNIRLKIHSLLNEPQENEVCCSNPNQNSAFSVCLNYLGFFCPKF